MQHTAKTIVLLVAGFSSEGVSVTRKGTLEVLVHFRSIKWTN